ncbi:hypothetical protein [Arsukibacterium indicum]|uniref:Uncharacterized protein n=1 Tax=Arsukibacterium indicum TaxID=2848612 RepID=A0ABS6MGH4_9GAMM|nr:hypothetical protein [Arsukibacterium indicum]MBV2127917.1 hypothetical protein [Arsukibacterium indicum]
MAQPVTVFRWDDPGAPQLVDGKPSEIINILTKCLVDGYGTQLPLGWTRPFYDPVNQAAAFRNNVAAGGSGGYTKIYSNDNSDANHALMRITHAVSMTDISTLVKQGWTHAFATINATGDNRMDKWALIGTATAFYFFISRNAAPMGENANSYYNPTIFVGDFFSRIPNDTGRFITIATTGSAGDTTNASSFTQTLDFWSSQPPGTSQSLIKIYNADNAAAFSSYTIKLSGINGGSSGDVGFAGEPLGEHALVNVMIFMLSSSTADGSKDINGVVLANSVVSPLFRGVLPGFYDSFAMGYRLEPWPKIIGINGDDYWLLRNSHRGPCHLMIKLGEWNDPFSGS